MPIINIYDEEPVLEVSNYNDLDIFLDIICASADCYDESAIKELKSSVVSVADLWNQWSKYTKSFIKHKWLYRYINENQKKILKYHYDILCNDTDYANYKKSFNYICKFMGLPNNTVILEDIVFDKDKKDKSQDIISVRYSKGKIKVHIPEGIYPIHAHPTSDNIHIDDLIPSFRSKTKGKFLYPTKRCFFSLIKPISSAKFGSSGKMDKYTTKEKITTAYIDPTYPEFGNNSVYIETDKPIPVENYKSLLQRMFRKEE